MSRFTQEEEAQAQVDMWKYIFGFTEMAAIRCAVELGIADIVEKSETPVTVSELSSTLGCSSSSSLYRIMRFLTMRGIFKEVEITEGSIGYVQTPLSCLLMKQGEHSMAQIMLADSSPVMLACCHTLSAHVLDSEVIPFRATHGDNLWTYAANNPEFSKLFVDGMACSVRITVSAILDGCPEVFEGLRSMVDVGGGDGTALGLIVKSCPWIRGINFDLPHVVSAAPKRDGVEHVGGDMLASSIPKADVVCMMVVLHGLDDDKSIAILKKCKEAIPQDTGKVIMVEVVVGGKEDNKFKDVGLMLDVAMMLYANKGKERTEQEWEYILQEAGFSRYTIKQIHDIKSVIVAYP